MCISLKMRFLSFNIFGNFLVIMFAIVLMNFFNMIFLILYFFEDPVMPGFIIGKIISFGMQNLESNAWMSPKVR